MIIWTWINNFSVFAAIYCPCVRTESLLWSWVIIHHLSFNWTFWIGACSFSVIWFSKYRTASKICCILGPFPEESCQDQWVWLALVSQMPPLSCPWGNRMPGFPSWGKVMCFAARCPWLDFGIHILKLWWWSEDCSQMYPDRIKGLAGLGLLGHCLHDTVVPRIIPVEMSHFSCPAAHSQNLGCQDGISQAACEMQRLSWDLISSPALSPEALTPQQVLPWP